jgi:hypothetical protein
VKTRGLCIKGLGFWAAASLSCGYVGDEEGKQQTSCDWVCGDAISLPVGDSRTMMPSSRDR